MAALGYSLLDPVSREVRYIGVTSQDPGRRLAAHIDLSNRLSATNHRISWIQSLLKRGLKPEMVVNATFQTMSEALAWEVQTIGVLRSKGHALVNSTSGGEGTVGCVRSSEARRKTSQALLGRPRSHEVKLRIGLAHLGHRHSPEACKRMSQAHKGLRHSDKSREKIFIAHLKRTVEREILRTLGFDIRPERSRYKQTLNAVV